MAKRDKVRFGIFQKILLTTLTVSLIPLGCIWYLDYRSTLEVTSEGIDQKLQSFTTNLATHVDDWIEMNQRMLLQNSGLKDVMSSNANDQNPVLTSIIRQYPWTYLAFTTDLQGNNVGRSDGKPLKYYGDRDYIKQVTQGAQFGQQVLIGKTSGKPALVLSSGIFDLRSKLQGIIAIAMSLNDLSDNIIAARIGKSGFAFLLDEKGEVIAHPNDTFTQTRADFSNHPAFVASAAGARRTVFVDDKGERIVAGMLKTKEGWTLIAQQNFKEAYAPIQVANRQALLLLCVTLVIVAACAFLLSRKLAAPIRSLTETTDQFSQGKLNVSISGLQRKDEIGELARAIERLGMSIKVAIKRLKQT